MSFLHMHSCECNKSELDLFNLLPTQTSIENSYWVRHNPISSLVGDTPLEFTIPGSGDEYLDLAHTLFYVKVSITTNAELGPNRADDIAKVGPVNNFMHSIFGQVDVAFNHQPVSSQNNAYAYRAYIETLLNYGPAAKASHLSSVLWADDLANQMNSLTDNTGLVKRRDWMGDAKTIDMVGHLHCDVFNQDKLLLNGVEVSIKMHLNRDGFAIMDPTNVYKVHIDEASVLVRKVKISPTVLVAHANALAKQSAKYPITRVQIKSIVLHANIHGESIDNIILGQLPKRIIVGFVRNSAFNGNRRQNPFNFEHFGISHISMYVDGTQVPSRQLQPNFNNGLYAEAYQSLFSGTGFHFLNQGNSISREAYAGGYCLFAYDLTPDLSANDNTHWNLVRHGSVRLDVRFREPLTATVNCIIYGEYANVLEIDAARQCIVDFS